MLNSNNKNLNVQLSFAVKKSLEGMETAAWSDIPGAQSCGTAKSPFTPEVSGLIEKLNPFLAARAAVPSAAALLNNPPRGEEQVGVYLCGGLAQPAYTIHRTVFFNAGFIEVLNAAASGWGGEPAFRSALAFILYHEIGHAALGHSAAALESGGGFGPPEEVAADQFAYDAMAAAGIGYSGVELAKYQTGVGRFASARP